MISSDMSDVNTCKIRADDRMKISQNCQKYTNIKTKSGENNLDYYSPSLFSKRVITKTKGVIRIKLKDD